MRRSDMAGSDFSGEYTARRKRCEILHGLVSHIHVGVPYRVQLAAGRKNADGCSRRVGRDDDRLACACNIVHHTLPRDEMAACNGEVKTGQAFLFLYHEHIFSKKGLTSYKNDAILFLAVGILEKYSRG